MLTHEQAAYLRACREWPVATCKYIFTAMATSVLVEEAWSSDSDDTVYVSVTQAGDAALAAYDAEHVTVRRDFFDEVVDFVEEWGVRPRLSQGPARPRSCDTGLMSRASLMLVVAALSTALGVAGCALFEQRTTVEPVVEKATRALDYSVEVLQCAVEVKRMAFAAGKRLDDAAALGFCAAFEAAPAVNVNTPSPTPTVVI